MSRLFPAEKKRENNTKITVTKIKKNTKNALFTAAATTTKIKSMKQMNITIFFSNRNLDGFPV